jgi:membrane-associated phospholipid phosphatase
LCKCPSPDAEQLEAQLQSCERTVAIEIRLPGEIMRPHIKPLALAAGIMLVAACVETSTAPNLPDAERSTAANSAVKFWDVGASTRWNELATDFTTRRLTNAVRLYAYLSLAQFRAAQAAQAIRPHPPTSSAIGAASAVVLSSFFPDDIVEIEGVLEAQRAETAWPGAKHEDFAAGEAVGRAIGARVVVYSRSDRFGLADPGTPPVGPGYWRANGGPIVRGNYRARPFFIASDSEFRPAPPPPFGSPEYLAALAEVRHISDTRTPEQVAIALYWNLNQSPTRNAAMNDLAVDLIRSYRRRDAEAARILFVANAAAFDALVGCFDAKYHYWFIRPPQADPGIVTVFPVPGHPSYPSAHSCISGAMTGVLSTEFPSETARVDSVALEASLSRLYAGIHYRFDFEAGLALGRAVAAKAEAAKLDEVAVLP